MTDIIEQIDADEATRKEVKVGEYEYFVPKNRSFYSNESASSILIKLLLLFVRDTEIEMAKGEEQRYFYELDKEMWKLTVTTKQKVVLDETDILGVEDNYDYAGEPKYYESVMEIVVLNDDEDEDKRVVFFRHVSGDLNFLQEGQIRDNKMIQDLKCEWLNSWFRTDEIQHI